jgi:hypothetical protein
MVVFLLTMMVVALLAATPAWASSPSNVRVEFFPDDANHAGEQATYSVFFTATSALSGRSDYITISAPAGTVFPDRGYRLTNFFTKGKVSHSYTLPDDGVVVSDGGSTVSMYLGDSNVAISPGDLVSVTTQPVTNPSKPGEYTLSVSTSKDTEPATSAPYTILPALVGGPPPVPEEPTAKEQCKKGGYEEFGFKNQGQCVAFVQRGPKNKGEVPSS